MVRGDSVRRESGHVLARSVAGVVVPNILRIAHAESRHEEIARDFGDDGRARNAEAPRIAVHDGRVRDGKRAHGAPVDHDAIRPDLEAVQRAPHGKNARLIDVDAIDLAHRGGAKRERDRALADLDGEADALIGRQSLGVVHSGDGARFGGHYHGAGDDGSRDRASAYFVDTGEERALLDAQVALDGRPALPPRSVPAAGLLSIGIWSFVGRLGSARFDLVTHAVLRWVSEESARPRPRRRHPSLVPSPSPARALWLSAL